jgi:transcriptional regulator with XRE-family HTH domain
MSVTPAPFAVLLRRLRAGRRMSQLELALSCDASARHVSFLETGRAQPSRTMVLRLAEALLLPLGTRNTLLQAAGFAPVFPASALDSAALAPFRAMLAGMMAGHAPNPALLVDRHPHPAAAAPRRPLVPLILTLAGHRLSFLSAIAHFGTSHDVTVRDLRLELLFPADEITADALAGLPHP